MKWKARVASHGSTSGFSLWEFAEGCGCCAVELRHEKLHAAWRKSCGQALRRRRGLGRGPRAQHATTSPPPPASPPRQHPQGRHLPPSLLAACSLVLQVSDNALTRDYAPARYLNPAAPTHPRRSSETPRPVLQPRTCTGIEHILASPCGP